jgi:phosphoribosylformylglycinamidine cyclo-ligase
VEAVIDPRTWEVPRIFSEIQRLGDVSDDEMRKVFNMGIGMVAIVSANDCPMAMRMLKAKQIGRIVKGSGKTRLTF